ncbi:MAG: GTP 3',8-cyclase MoaA [Alphaproteobacteria bacterium]|nr:GTP 3',8-cyclase MoaA [Alphaproteobacteria bacterium]
MIDNFGRKINYLRFSITDRCDLRCKYCMPIKNQKFYKKDNILTTLEIKKILSLFIETGIKKIRITGGEPLIRKDILEIITFLKNKKKKKLIEEILITTNGTQLKKYAKNISDLGVDRINVSLDTLIPEKFQFITNGGNLRQVLDGLVEAKKLKIKIKINTVLLKNFNEDEIKSMVTWCKKHSFKQSFIEVMPVGEVNTSRTNQFLPVSYAKALIKKNFGLENLSLSTNGPSKYYKTSLGNVIGFISPLTNNFCSSCNRIRVTSNGMLYPCLGDNGSVDLKSSLHKSDSEIIEIIKNSIYHKPEKHFFDIKEKSYVQDRFMNTTGG